MTRSSPFAPWSFAASMMLLGCEAIPTEPPQAPEAIPQATAMVTAIDYSPGVRNAVVFNYTVLASTSPLPAPTARPIGLERLPISLPHARGAVDLDYESAVLRFDLVDDKTQKTHAAELSLSPLKFDEAEVAFQPTGMIAFDYTSIVIAGDLVEDSPSGILLWTRILEPEAKQTYRWCVINHSSPSEEILTPHALAVLPDSGKRLAFLAGSTNTLRFWSLGDAKAVAVPKTSAIPDSDRIVALFVTETGPSGGFDLLGGTTFSVHPDIVASYRFSPSAALQEVLIYDAAEERWLDALVSAK